MKTTHDTVVILDFGAINSQAAAKIVRSLNVYCEVLPCTASAERIAALSPKALILQRGAACGDATLGRTPAADPAAFGVPVLDLNGLPCDAATIEPFLLAQCALRQDWTTDAFIADAIAGIRETVGDRNVLLAMSGGVDSSVCAVLVHRAVGEQLTCVFVDHGLMRKDEPEEVCRVFRDGFGIALRHINAEARFLGKLAGVTDPERKRMIIGEEFIRVFEEEARAAGEPDFLVQGTIYPDIIESGWDGGKPVKAHHNVGGLPKNIDFKGLVEPIKYLFKDEVRQVALALGIPAAIAMRQPFPGPGLGVRCIGELTKEKLDILREVDAIFRQAIVDNRLEEQASQYFAVLTGNRSVGVSDDARTYAYTVALRAVRTSDFMTARFVKIPMDILEAVSERITANVPQVNRVVYDITSKPPATIEWE
ncbi:MAG: glutamine-hydrolyzing GMP synthase [Kiritimatiellae bacterium]|jgi:GMP synthase (glutamine-hydrolysing)|nr:glutamine-hydrolyzing GMP synthase [Kiritimatiellia bacterium]MDD4174948.1 glutamine-hydrolyzing GMP synthase [Kiritimatiellia bacterium]MDD4442839.1 glutamine-hydrolyzing GMP synthase [Kiritimatiellia bacterium]MDX9793540.1 glutamine-hydrolyzing GMP synthase [Kiritimatiellia bacterium]HPB12191.1 glutamine-hydrolyzing GMP synthase [Kiritimatiellia bacterium]